MIVADVKKWKKIVLSDRVVLVSDLKLLSNEQKYNLSQLVIKEIKDNGKTLVC